MRKEEVRFIRQQVLHRDFLHSENSAGLRDVILDYSAGFDELVVRIAARGAGLYNDLEAVLAHKPADLVRRQRASSLPLIFRFSEDGNRWGRFGSLQ